MNITAQNTFTPAVLIQSGNIFDVSISGTFVATVTVQRSKDAATWFDLDKFTAAAEKTGVSGSAWYFRVGVKTGEFTSGTIVAAIY
ncbi:hypothetical protein NKH16_20005 [Mesorhizobium sp. M1307]|uniref:hypothetical protein n=1 Tax=Mesorhizobium sp. M1307 TaxID=2957079 RepID=UPI003339C359